VPDIKTIAITIKDSILCCFISLHNRGSYLYQLAILNNENKGVNDLGLEPLRIQVRKSYFCIIKTPILIALSTHYLAKDMLL
jgi:hypothetical protein